MIKIKIGEDYILSTGHSKNEPCTRVSTVFDILTSIMQDYVEIDRQPGISYVKYKLSKKADIDIFGKFVLFFEDLTRLYPNMIFVEREVKNG